MKRPPFGKESERRELARRLSEIHGMSIPEAALNKRPSFKLSLLTGSGSLEKFLAAFDWVLTEIRRVEVMKDLDPVSYTHLTLPTILRV